MGAEQRRKRMKLEKNFLKIIKNAAREKTHAYDTTATVTRVEKGTAWVHIDGGVPETPAELTIAAKVGDQVKVRVSGGRAYLIGNSTAPPTDNSAVIDQGRAMAEALTELELKKLDKTAESGGGFLALFSKDGRSLKKTNVAPKAAGWMEVTIKKTTASGTSITPYVLQNNYGSDHHCEIYPHQVQIWGWRRYIKLSAGEGLCFSHEGGAWNFELTPEKLSFLKNITYDVQAQLDGAKRASGKTYSFSAECTAVQLTESKVSASVSLPFGLENTGYTLHISVFLVRPNDVSQQASNIEVAVKDKNSFRITGDYAGTPGAAYAASVIYVLTY
jgi:hypothetical protein